MENCDTCVFWDSDEHNRGCSHPDRLIFPGRYNTNADSCGSYRLRQGTSHPLPLLRTYVDPCLLRGMVPKYVYLAGPITGLTYYEATGWREDVADRLDGSGITCLSPLRGMEILKDKGPLSIHHLGQVGLNPRSVVTRDYNDVKRSELVFANLSQFPKKASVGTISEIGWAYGMGKVVVVEIGSKSDNVHRDPMLMQAAGGFVYSDRGNAIEAAKGVLLP